jgi:hypothetical protein
MIKILVMAVTILGFSSLSFAQAKPATPATPATPAAPAEKKTEAKSQKTKTSRITGEVTSVDSKAGTLAVKAKDKEVNLTAESKSAKSALEKVKQGDRVRVSYTEKDGKMIATSVTAASKTTAGKSDKPAQKKSETK